METIVRSLPNTARGLPNAELIRVIRTHKHPYRIGRRSPLEQSSTLLLGRDSSCTHPEIPWIAAAGKPSVRDTGGSTTVPSVHYVCSLEHNHSMTNSR